MGISLTGAARCPVAEMVAAHRRERDAVRRSHLQMIWLLLDGMATAEVSRVTGFGAHWIEKLINRWSGAGIAGLGDRRWGNAGREPVLNAAGQAALTALLEGVPADSGLWSGRKVAAWMSERLYLYGFVRPRTGDVEWWVADGIGVDLFQKLLEAFARDVGAGPKKTVILLIDNAGWHISRRLKLPDGIRFCFPPPYTPELQPAERLWPLTNEGVANRPFDTLDQLAETLDRQCAALIDQPDLIKATTHFEWWPDE